MKSFEETMHAFNRHFRGHITFEHYLLEVLGKRTDIYDSLYSSKPFLSFDEDFLHITWWNDRGDRVNLELNKEEWWLSYIPIGKKTSGEVFEITPGDLEKVTEYIRRLL